MPSLASTAAASSPVEGHGIFIIRNPASGAGRARDLALPADAGRIAMRRTEAPGHATELAAQAAADGYRIVVAAGGDGTVNEVARGLLGTSAALGIVPLGSGNGLARHLGIPRHPAAALQRLLNPRFEHIDVGRINGRHFLCTAGLGFDAHVSRRFAEGPRRGLAGYVRAALAGYRSHRPAQVELHFAGNRLATPAYLCAFANASQYGNDARICPHADLADGVLDICLIDTMPFWRAIRVAHGMMRGDLTTSGAVTYHSADRITATADTILEFHVDGEFAGESRRFEVDLLHHALEVAT